MTTTETTWTIDDRGGEGPPVVGDDHVVYTWPIYGGNGRYYATWVKPQVRITVWQRPDVEDEWGLQILVERRGDVPADIVTLSVPKDLFEASDAFDMVTAWADMYHRKSDNNEGSEE